MEQETNKTIEMNQDLLSNESEDSDETELEDNLPIAYNCSNCHFFQLTLLSVEPKPDDYLLHLRCNHCGFVCNLTLNKNNDSLIKPNQTSKLSYLQ